MTKAADGGSQRPLLLANDGENSLEDFCSAVWFRLRQRSRERRADSIKACNVAILKFYRNAGMQDLNVAPDEKTAQQGREAGDWSGCRRRGSPEFCHGFRQSLLEEYDQVVF